MISRDLLDQLVQLLAPIRNQIANVVTRAIIGRVVDSSTLQSVNIGVMVGQELDGAERFQDYGFSSVPLAGAEAVVVFPSGDSGHPLVIAVDDRRFRPTGHLPGEVAIYHKDGAMILLKAGGAIQVDSAPGQKVFVSDGSGGESPVALLSDVTSMRADLDGHEHRYIPALHPGTGTVITTSGPSVTVPVGAKALEAK